MTMETVKIDMDMGDGVNITVSAEAETKKEALYIANSRASAIIHYIGELSFAPMNALKWEDLITANDQ